MVDGAHTGEESSAGVGKDGARKKAAGEHAEAGLCESVVKSQVSRSEPIMLYNWVKRI